MSKPLLRTVLSLVFFVSLKSFAAPGVVVNVAASASNRYLVKLAAGVSPSSQGPVLVSNVGGTLVHIFTTAQNGFSFVGTSTMALEMSNQPGVAEVWEVGTVRLAGTQYAPPSNLDRLDDRDLPLDGRFTYTEPTRTANIYILDTGVDPFSDLNGRLTNINFSTNAAGVRDPNDFRDSAHWHGTATAIIAAGTNYGVAKFAKVVNVRVLGGTGGTYDDVAAGIQWVTQQALSRPSEIHVANASWGSAAAYPPVEEEIRKSIAAGVAWSFAAGNKAEDACGFFPAKLGRQISGAMSVGGMIATEDKVWQDSPSNGSNQGPCVEIFAPTFVVWGTPSETEGTVAGGTSAAAPHVAGVLAIRLASAVMTIGEAEGLVKGLATPDHLTNIWPTSPNLLLFSLSTKRRAAGS